MNHRRPGPKHPVYGIPAFAWPMVVHRVVELMEPLRIVAATYGVSHETIRLLTPVYNWLMRLFGEALAKWQKLATRPVSHVRRGRKGMPTTPLLPLPDGLEITAISVAEQELQVRVTSNRLSSLFPLCSTPPFALHSSYRRTPLELPSTGKTVRFLLSVKKFFCRAAWCPRKIFTEWLPEVLEPSSRLTTRLRSMVQAICAAFNAKGGARLGKQLGIRLSRKTFLRSLPLMPTPSVGNVKAVGIDDFAWKRGKRYGTVIVDLETHR